jgi:hypothetical protein
VPGDSVEIGGIVTDQENRSVSTFVEITVLTPENTSLLFNVIHSDAKGMFFTLLSLPSDAQLGTYWVIATPVVSPPVNVTFSVVRGSITCCVNQSFMYPGTPTLIYGQVYPSRSLEILLKFSQNDRDWQTLGHAFSNSSGYYYIDWKVPEEAGNYSIQASIGNVTSPSAHLKVVVREPTMITISLKTSVITVGSSVQLDGTLDSTSGNATIAIQYVNPDGVPVHHLALADPDGNFKDTFSPDMEGTWSISASWSGDALNEPTASMVMELVVKPAPPTKLFLSIVVAEDIAVIALLAMHLSNKRRIKRLLSK